MKCMQHKFGQDQPFRRLMYISVWLLYNTKLIFLPTQSYREFHKPGSRTQKAETRLEVKLTKAPYEKLVPTSDPQRNVLRTFLRYQQSLIEKQLQCVTQELYQNKPLPPSRYSAPSTASVFLRIYKELVRLLSLLKDREDVFQKSLSDYTTTRDVKFSTDFMKEVKENQKGVQNLIGESFKHGCFESSFPWKLPTFEGVCCYQHVRTLYRRMQTHHQHMRSETKQQITREKLLHLQITEILPSYKSILSGILSTLHPIVEELEEKQTEHKIVSPAHVMADKFLKGVEMKMTEMEMNMGRSLKILIAGKVSMVHESREQLRKSRELDLVDCVYLINEYHAVTWEQIKTLCFLPLWFVNRENLSDTEKSSFNDLKHDLTLMMHDLFVTEIAVG